MPFLLKDDVNYREFVNLLEGWAGRVLRLRDELDSNPSETPGYWGPYDLVGAYHHRQRLDALIQEGYPYLLRAADLLLAGFSQEVGRKWVDAIGLADEAGDGWWWSLIPERGPCRFELETRGFRANSR